MKPLKYIALSLLIVVLTTPYANAARLYFYPQVINVLEGDSFIVEVRIDTEGESINALEIEGTVKNGTIESVGTANSLVEIFIESVKTSDNSFKFSGGTPGGFIGDGVIGRLTVRANETGAVNISFNDGPNLLSGTGESVKAQIVLLTASAVVTEKSGRHISITSRSHPDQNTWYNKGDLHLRWNLEEGVNYSYLVSFDPSAIPDNNVNRPTGSLEWQGDINIEGLAEGIYYFSLKRVGESEISRYRVMIDTTPPEWVAFEMSEGVPETNGRAFLAFLAKDELSGISHYEVAADETPAQTLIAPYILPDDFGIITITAYDRAGNSVERTVIGKTQRNIFVLYAVVLLIVVGGAVVAIKPIRERIFTEKSDKKE